MTELHTWLIISVIVLITALTRFLPFLVWNGDKNTPEIIDKLGRVLPYAIMGMLVVYCLKDISFEKVGGYLPAFLSCLAVGVTYVWKRNTLISIVCGTVCYMILIQMVF